VYTFRTDLSDFYRQIGEEKRKVERVIPAVMEVVGIRIVEWLRSTDPSFGIQSGGRVAHPGHWADDSSNLSRGYAYEVIPTNQGFTLRFSNNIEYAAELDEKEGYFVLSGVADHMMAPAIVELKRALRSALPHYQIEIG